MVFCTQCGTQATEGQRFCVVCGSALPISAVAGDSTSTPAAPATGGAMPAWTPAPPMSGGERALSSTDVVFQISPEPVTQSRWSVFFRLILSLPLFVWVVILEVVTQIVVIVGWFAALLTGRVPGGIQRFVTSVVRYTTEVLAYSSVLVARWPGFSLHPGDRAQVEIRIDHVRLNRVAVFFRVVLSIPAIIVVYFVEYGGYVLTIGVWISALILGRPARPLYGARVLALRFTTRSIAYFALLTPTQPFSGFFGDHVVPGSVSVGEGIDAPATGATTLSSRLILSTSARVLFIGSLIVGGIGGVVYQRTVFNFRGIVNRVIIIPLVTGTEKNVVGDLNTFSTAITSCGTQANVACVASAAGTANRAIGSQVVTLNGVSGLVSRGRIQYNQYVFDLNRVDADLTVLINDTSVTQQQAFIVDTLTPDIAALTAEYEQLRAAL